MSDARENLDDKLSRPPRPVEPQTHFADPGPRTTTRSDDREVERR